MSEVISLKHLSKVYPATRKGYLPLLWGQRPSTKTAITALRDLTFSVNKGEIIGIVGHNGAGKSSLLRLLAGISTPTGGTCSVHGSIGTLLDLSAGMQPFKTGRQNIHLRLALLGYSPQEIAAMEPEIIAFSELEASIDKEFATYSSGMKMRLAFSLATAITPDILLIDEALAVGDEFFSAKSFLRIEELARSGCTAIIVSHDWNRIFRLATRIIWIDKGTVKQDGKPVDILYQMLLSLNAFNITGRVSVDRVEITSDNGTPKRSFKIGETICVTVHYTKTEDCGAFSVICGASVPTTGESVLSAYSPDDGFVVNAPEKSGCFSFTYPDICLAPGPYDLTFSLADAAQGPFPVEYLAIWGPLFEDDCRIVIEGEQTTGSLQPLVTLTPSWKITSQ